MDNVLSTLDWLVFAAYISLLVGVSVMTSRAKVNSSQDYFLGGNQMSLWVVAVSVLATSQSAATFLGGPDLGYRGDLSYLASMVGAVLAALFVAVFLLPRFYAMRATTVYELLEQRFGERGMKASAFMYFTGRIFASGARLYLAAIALSMLFFGDIEVASIVFTSLLLVIVAFSLTFIGGIRAVIWSDLLQFIVYFGAALAALVYLYGQVPHDFQTIYGALAETPAGVNKLQIFDFSTDLHKPFTFWASITGLFLLNVAALGLDQDMTQRLLTCKNANESKSSALLATILTIPVMLLFIIIGFLLFLFYDLNMAPKAISAQSQFSGQTITIFMHYVLTQLPSGLKGLVIVGVTAAAISSLNSGMNSMSSVLVKDFYAPYANKKKPLTEKKMVIAGRVGMAFVAAALLVMSWICFYWQQYSDIPLLQFALGVMVFSYSGLLGVFFTSLFTKRGSSRTVVWALWSGFGTTFLLQQPVAEIIGLPLPEQGLAFPWQLCLGASVSFAVCLLGKNREQLS